MDLEQGVISTIHALRAEPAVARALRERVAELSHARKVGLVLPMLYAEVTRPAFARIREELAKADFLNEIVVPLTARGEDQVERVQRALRGLPAPVRVLWVESPDMRDLLASLDRHGIDMRDFRGKGLAVWAGMGVATLENHAILLTDADVETYSVDMLARLALPLADPAFDFYFSKGYYARISHNRMFGRVTRLFLWPFLDALLANRNHASPFLRYMRAFRYPLAGEFAVQSDLALNVRVPTDWGLELGLLGEVYRNASLKRICQVDLGLYSHKHKPFTPRKEGGLHRMVRDLTTTLLRLTVENEGVEVSEATLLSLRVLYRRIAQDYVRRFYVDANANGLLYDRHEEELMIEAFAGLIEAAGRQYVRRPGREQVPDWLRTLSAQPDFHRRVRSTASLAPRGAREELRALAEGAR